MVRWWCGPASLGWGRKFCVEFCDTACQAQTPETCSSEPVEPLPANAFAWSIFRSTFWQWQSSGFGDGTLNGVFVQNKLADKGIEGPERDDQMERLRVLAETYQEMQAIEAKEKKKP